MQRTVSAWPSGTGWPERRQASLILAGMSPGGRKAGSSGSTSGPPRGSSPAAASCRGSSPGSPARRHTRMDSCKSQRPVTLRR